MKNILFVAPPLYGHITQLLIVAEEMRGRGYHVYFASGRSFESRIHAIGAEFLEWNPELVDDIIESQRYRKLFEMLSREADIIEGEKLILEVITGTYSFLYSRILSFFEQTKFDLVIADRVALTAMDISRQHNIPLVVMTRFLSQAVRPQLRYPQYGTPYHLDMKFYQRAFNVFQPVRMFFRLYRHLRSLNNIRKKCSLEHGHRVPISNIPTLVGTTFDIEFPRALPSHVRLIGPVMALSHTEISKSLEEWLNEEPNKPIVYISLGTLVIIDQKQADAIIEGATDDRFRVLWSMPERQKGIISRGSPSIRIESFVPQTSILAHPRIMLFLSHCGMNSVNESLYFGKPMLCLPFFSDQHYNAARVVDCGAGIKLEKNKLESGKIKKAIFRLLDEKLFSENAQKISSKLQCSNGRKMAADILEQILKNNIILK